MSKLGRAAAAAVVASALVTGVAYGATIYAAPPNQFLQGDVTIAQGEKVTFTNGDTQTHDVTAVAKGPGGKPLFASAQIGPGQSAPVDGVEFLTTGKYDYICSIHPFMKGTITVTADGTPQPRPGGGGGTSSPAADTTAPALSLKLLDTKRSKVRRRRSLQVAVTTDEPVTVAVSARSGRAVLAKGSAKLANAGTRKLSVKLTQAGLKAVKGRKPVTVAVVAQAKDSAGNASSAQASGRLR